jgi:hypothetical protein
MQNAKCRMARQESKGLAGFLGVLGMAAKGQKAPRGQGATKKN